MCVKLNKHGESKDLYGKIESFISGRHKADMAECCKDCRVAVSFKYLIKPSLLG